MIIVLISIMLAFVILYYFIMKKEVQKDKEKNLVMLIVLTNVLLSIIMGFWVTLLKEKNLLGIGIFILINVLVLIFSKKLSQKKITLIISLIIYFLIIFITPVYELEGHEHIFDYDNMETIIVAGKEMEFPKEKIKHYVRYYNCYNIRIFEE